MVDLPLASAPAAVTEQQPVARALAQRRVLIVDDNQDAAVSLGMLVEISQSEVRIARSGREALTTFEQFDPAFVLLDIGMPDMDGYEVARTIRSRYADRHPVLVALTGWGQETDRARAREAGFDHHLVKPTDFATLMAILGAGSGRAGSDRSRPAD